jgi:tRNA(Ile)-lysidine synthase
MLKQLTAGGARTRIAHDGRALRLYRGKVFLEEDRGKPAFESVSWDGEASLKLPELGGELRFRTVRGQGFSRALCEKALTIRLRRGGERLQPDPRRPRRTLKNLFQEAGVPPWERDRLPLLACGDDLVWVPGLGVDARYRAADNARGVLPEWRKMPR